MEYYSAIKTMPFAAIWMDIEIIINAVSQRKTNIIYCLYVET